jgi:hypothetical protein
VARVAPVGGGLFLLGISAYVARQGALAPRATRRRPLYLLVAMEVDREVSSRRPAGLDTDRQRSGLIVGAGYAGLVAVVLLAAAWCPRARWLRERRGGDRRGQAAAVHTLRGLFAGERRFGWYAASLGLEGAARLVPCVVLALAGSTDPLAYGWAFALGTGIAALACLPGRTSWHRRWSVPAAHGPATNQDSVATVHATAVPDPATDRAPVPAATMPGVVTDGPARTPPPLAGAPVQVRVMARATVFRFRADLRRRQPPAGASPGFRLLRRSRRFVSLFVLAASPCSCSGRCRRFSCRRRRRRRAGRPPHVRSWLGSPPPSPPSASCALLTAAPTGRRTFSAHRSTSAHRRPVGVGTVAMLAAQVRSLRRALRVHRMATTAWVVGALAFGAVLVAPVDPATAAVTAQVVGPTVVCLVMGVAIAARLRRMVDDPAH